jgi:predicted extracellular nuclease
MKPLRRILILFILFGSQIYCGPMSTYFIAFWNVENLFDTIDDPQTKDDEFTPTGQYEWTPERLRYKIELLSGAINDVNETRGPDILGFAEIENIEVLNALNSKLNRNYQIIHRDSPDERGIDAALLYDASRFKLVGTYFHRIPLGYKDTSREIIEGVFMPIDENSDAKLYVFVNHWPSHYGGSKKTDAKRRIAAQTLRDRINLIEATQPNADIIVMGDLNDYPNMPSIYEVLSAKESPEVLLPSDLFNTTWHLHETPGQGTHAYGGEWGVLDQIIVSQGMLDKKGFSWQTNSTLPNMPSYLINQSGKYEGAPFRMFGGGQYLGGYSDHLMITCKIILN